MEEGIAEGHVWQGGVCGWERGVHGMHGSGCV